jgi:hypothetical protein
VTSTTTSIFGRQRASAFWMRVLPFAMYMLFLAITPLLADTLSNVDARWFYGIKIVAVVVVLALFWRHFGELGMPRLSWREAGLAWLVGLAVFVAWINLNGSWISFMSNDPADGYDPRTVAGNIDWWLAATRLAGAALVVPIMEELFWRSLVMRWLDRSNFLAVDSRAVSLRALVASSVVFGFEHHLWLAGIVAGLAYGELYRRSGNLWVPLFAHGVTNGALGIWVLSTGSWQYW